MSLIRNHHRKHPNGYSYMTVIIFMFFYSPVHGYLQLHVSLFWIQTDKQLPCISVMVCQRNKDSLSFFFYRNINPLISISVGFCGYRKTIWLARMRRMVVTSYLSAQIIFHFMDIYLSCQKVILSVYFFGKFQQRAV